MWCVYAYVSYLELRVGAYVLLCLGMRLLGVAAGCVPVAGYPHVHVCGWAPDVRALGRGGGSILSTQSDTTEGSWRPQGQ